MILIFLKIFVEGFLNPVFREQVSEIQFCFISWKPASDSVIKSAVESSLSYSSFHSPTPRLSIPQLSFQRGTNGTSVGLAPLLFSYWRVHSPKAATAPFQFVLGFMSCQGKSGLCHL